MDKKHILKIIRIVACMPMLALFILAIYNSFNGVDAFKDYRCTGYEAFVLTIVAYGFKFFWIFIISLIAIIVASILTTKDK